MLLKIIFSCMSFNKDRKKVFIFLIITFYSTSLMKFTFEMYAFRQKAMKIFLLSISLLPSPTRENKNYLLLKKNMYRRSRELLIFPPFLLLAFILKFNTQKNALNFRVGVPEQGIMRMITVSSDNGICQVYIVCR